MAKYEYQVTHAADELTSRMNELLDDQAAKGWELVTVTLAHSRGFNGQMLLHYDLWWKRELTNDQPQRPN